MRPAAALRHHSTASGSARLGLGLVELEELLTAIGDRQDAVSRDAFARLERARRAIERELCEQLTA